MTAFCALAFAFAVLWDNAEVWHRSLTRRRLQRRINGLNLERQI